MPRVSAVLDRIASLLELVVAFVFMALFLVTMLNIVLRNLGGIAWLWIPGFMRLAFIWLVFLGVAVAYRRHDHLVVDFFLKRMPTRARSVTTLAIDAALVPFFVLLVVFGRDLALVRMRIPFDTWAVPTGYAYMAVPVSAALLLVFALERLVTTWLEFRRR
jgi:TRAP-type transport system small permease protein